MTILHRPTSADLDLIRRLLGLGLSLRAVALELTRLYPRSPWSRRKVWYHLDQERRLEDFGKGERPLKASWLRRKDRRRYQLEQGWGHLLPLADGKQPGHELPPALVDVLSVVRDNGPMTRGEIAAMLGRHDALKMHHDGGETMTAHLALLGLLARDRHRRYSLTTAALVSEDMPCYDKPDNVSIAP